MRRIFCLCLLVVLGFHVSGQRAAEVLEPGNSTLDERFQGMKDASETFQDYKVIKRNLLDGMWKITMDSVRAQKILLREANASIVKLQGELDSAHATIEEKDASVAEITHDSTHITVLGLDMSKTAFLSTVGVLLLALLVVIGVIFTRMRWVHAIIREKSEKVDSLNNEFEEYKRKALEKQMKLSRDLQTERNKLQELGSS